MEAKGAAKSVVVVSGDLLTDKRVNAKKKALTAKRLFDTMWESQQWGYRSDSTKTVSPRKHRASGHLLQKPITARMTPVVQDGVLKLQVCEPSAEWLSLFADHTVKVAYFELSGRPIDDVHREAMKAQNIIKASRSIPHPVVIGPVTSKHFAFIDSHLQDRVRTTPLKYKDYCKKMSETQSCWVETSTGHANDGPARR